METQTDWYFILPKFEKFAQNVHFLEESKLMTLWQSVNKLKDMVDAKMETCKRFYFNAILFLFLCHAKHVAQPICEDTTILQTSSSISYTKPEQSL